MATREQDAQAFLDPDPDQERRARIAAARARRDRLAGQITEVPGQAEAFARGTAAGATFEFDDEIVAALRTLAGADFSESIEAGRARKEASREEHPVAFGAGTVAGAGGATVAGGSVLQATRGAATGARIGLGRLTALGTAEGAIAGTGASEGVAERIPSAAVGAAAGGAAGFGIPVVGRAVGRLGRRFLDVTGLRPKGEESNVAGRLFSRFIDTVEERAEERLAAALPEGEDLVQATRRLSGSTRPLTIMDIDENVAGVARASRGVQGRAKTELPEFLSRRVTGQEQRVLDDALRLTGAGDRASIFESTQEIITRRAELAAPLYEAAYERTVPREVLGDVLGDDVFRKAYDRGVRIAKREGVDITPIGTLLPEGAGMVGPQEIPVQAIDYMKRGLDDLIEAGSRSAKGMGRQEARATRNQLRELLSRVDEVVPEYSEARATFAGESRMLDALEEGQRLFQMEPAEARSIIDGLPDSEREMFVRGGFEKLAEKVESASASFDVTKRAPLAKRTRDLERLRLLFPSDEAFAEFQSGLADEALIAHTNRFVTGGSNTAEKLAEMAELAGVDVASVISGNMLGLATRAGTSALRRRSQGFTGELGEAMLPSLTATGDEAVRALERLTNLRRGVGRELTMREIAAAGAAGTAAGAAAGRPANDTTQARRGR